jgi:hypothetical protein
MSGAGAPPDDRRFWLDDARNVRKVVVALIVVSGIFFLLSALYESHGFPVERLFGFHALFGFVGCAALILSAKGLRRLVKRPQGYYGSDDD